LSSCSDPEIEALQLALRHKQDLVQLGSLQEQCGTARRFDRAVWLVYTLAVAWDHGGFRPDREGKLALWQVIARVIDQGSRLSAVRLAARMRR